MLQVKEPSFVTIEGRKMAYDEVCPPNPKGTILLLTGLGSKRLGWYKQLDEFGKYYRTIALDHREVGDSDLTNAFYTTADQADDAAAVLKALGVARANIIGISMGGFISLELTLRHPEMVKKLVLVATSAGGATHVPPAPEMLAMLVNREPLEPGELARRNYTRIMAPGYLDAHPEEQNRVMENGRYRPMALEVYQRQLMACQGHNASPRLEQIKAPTLVIHGEIDPLVPAANGRYLAEHIPGARLILYPNTGHIPIIEQAEVFNRDVLNFLG
jgi:pimeloyl-ACP methyl ester carboxylesterase